MKGCIQGIIAFFVVFTAPLLVMLIAAYYLDAWGFEPPESTDEGSGIIEGFVSISYMITMFMFYKLEHRHLITLGTLLLGWVMYLYPGLFSALTTGDAFLHTAGYFI